MHKEYADELEHEACTGPENPDLPETIARWEEAEQAVDEVLEQMRVTIYAARVALERS